MTTLQPKQKAELSRESKPSQPKSKGQLQRLRHQMHTLEEKIAEQEKELRMIESQLSNSQVDSARLHQLASDYARIQAQLDEKILQWGELATTLYEN